MFGDIYRAVGAKIGGYATDVMAANSDTWSAIELMERFAALSYTTVCRTCDEYVCGRLSRRRTIAVVGIRLGVLFTIIRILTSLFTTDERIQSLLYDMQPFVGDTTLPYLFLV